MSAVANVSRSFLDPESLLQPHTSTYSDLGHTSSPSVFIKRHKPADDASKAKESGRPMKKSTGGNEQQNSNLLCLEQLNPEEINRSKESTEKTASQSGTGQKQVSKFCLSLPSSQKSQIRANKESRPRECLGSFGQSKNLGLSFCRKQRELRPAESVTVKTKNLIQLPSYLIVSPENFEGLDETKEKQSIAKTRKYL